MKTINEWLRKIRKNSTKNFSSSSPYKKKKHPSIDGDDVNVNENNKLNI